MSQKVQTATGLILYLVAAATLADAWSNAVDFGLGLATGLGMLMMMPMNPNRWAALAQALLMSNEFYFCD